MSEPLVVKCPKCGHDTYRISYDPAKQAARFKCHENSEHVFEVERKDVKHDTQ